MQAYKPENISIVLGDMNRSSDYFFSQFEEAAKNLRIATQPFIDIDIPYPTHISTQMEACWIDNIFIANPYPQTESHTAKDGSDLFEELQPTLDLLENSKP